LFDIVSLLDRARDAPELIAFASELLGKPAARVPAGFKAKGVELGFDRRRRVEAVFVYAAPRDGFAAFAGPWPRGLSPELDRSAVLELLGAPSASGPAGGWDRWDLPDHSLHLEYTAGGAAIGMLTLMAPRAVPR
jgi:hypothetical protein